MEAFYPKNALMKMGKLIVSSWSILMDKKSNLSLDFKLALNMWLLVTYGLFANSNLLSQQLRVNSINASGRGYNKDFTYDQGLQYYKGEPFNGIRFQRH